MKLEFIYDFMGRRISKKVYTGSTGNWTLASEKKFVYNEYKQIAEYSASDILQKTYVWQPISLDVPLWVKDGATYYYYIVDGNKNVRSMVDTSGSEVASYDYKPFGKIVVISGTYASINPFRFSSEYHDDETGLVYYNYRYYDPELGRWINRDPIGESDSNNNFNLLYGFVNNNSVYKFDVTGLTPTDLATKMLGRPLRKAIGWSLDSSVVIGSGVTFGLQTVFFPDVCKVGIFLYGPATIGENAKKDYDSRSEDVKIITRDLSLGWDVSLGVSGDIAFYKGKGKADPESWTKRFDGGTVGGSFIAKAAVGTFFSNEWIGFSGGFGFSATPTLNFKTTPQWFWLVKELNLNSTKKGKCLCYALILQMPG